MAKKPTSPLKITGHLPDGQINSSDGVIMLDGILYHAWFQKHAPEVLEGTGKNTFSGYFGLPLRHLPHNRYAASRGVYTSLGEKMAYINKRSDFFSPDGLHRLDMDSGQISSAVGIYRCFRIPQKIEIVKDGIITFYAMGHKDEVAELLDLMRFIGKKPAVGFGHVDRWTVEDCDEDYSLWHPEYGLMRPVEVDSDEAAGLDLSDYPIYDYAIKPPYWKPENFRRCYVPIKAA